MKDLIKSAINEAFGGCSTLIVIKRIIGMIIALVFLFVCCGAGSIDLINLVLGIGVWVLLWKLLGISKAFHEDKDED